MKKQNYKQTLNHLKQVVNFGRSKKGQDVGQDFKAVIKGLYDNFGKEISTKFLRALISLEKTNRYKIHRIKYLICKGGLKTKRVNRYPNGWIFQKWNTDITEYRHKENGLIYEGFPRHFFNEEMNLINEEGLNRRNAINKGGGVYVKDIKNQEVGRFFKGNSKEVLYFIGGF